MRSFASVIYFLFLIFVSCRSRTFNSGLSTDPALQYQSDKFNICIAKQNGQTVFGFDKETANVPLNFVQLRWQVRDELNADFVEQSVADLDRDLADIRRNLEINNSIKAQVEKDLLYQLDKLQGSAKLIEKALFEADVIENQLFLPLCFVESRTQLQVESNYGRLAVYDAMRTLLLKKGIAQEEQKLQAKVARDIAVIELKGPQDTSEFAAAHFDFYQLLIEQQYSLQLEFLDNHELNKDQRLVFAKGRNIGEKIPDLGEFVCVLDRRRGHTNTVFNNEKKIVTPGLSFVPKGNLTLTSRYDFVVRREFFLVSSVPLEGFGYKQTVEFSCGSVMRKKAGLSLNLKKGVYVGHDESGKSVNWWIAESSKENTLRAFTTNDVFDILPKNIKVRLLRENK
jgi:hypothetical protein